MTKEQTLSGQDNRISQAVRELSGDFTLPAFPGQEFFISLRKSYIDDSGNVKLVVMVYTNTLPKAFCTTTPDELRAQFQPVSF